MLKGAIILQLMIMYLASMGTHLRGGQITLTHVTGLTYDVKVTLYTNLSSEIRAGHGTLDFGDGSILELPDLISTSIDLNLGFAEYTVEHTYAAPANYSLSYTEPNLDAGIINVSHSLDIPLLLEAYIFLDGSGRDCSSPVFLINQAEWHPLQSTFSFSSQAIDKNDYSLYYQLVDPVQGRTGAYTMPENIRINPFNGLVTWDAKLHNTAIEGIYLFAVLVTQTDANGRVVGNVKRCIQIITENLNSAINASSSLNDVDGRIYVDPNSKKTIKVVLFDITPTLDLNWSVFFDEKISNNVTFIQYDSATSAQKMRIGILTLSSTPDIVRDHPYSISLHGRSQITVPNSNVFVGAINVFAAYDFSYLFYTKDIQIPVISGVEKPEIKPIAFPNPFKNQFRLSGDATEEEIEFSFTDMNGRKLFTGKSLPGNPIDASALNPGIYILTIRTESGISRQKVIKQ